MTARLLIEYDGTDFRGWAVQPGLRTVQGVLEDALGVVGRCAPPSLTVAGRTDAGVHASGQVASWAGPPVDARALNAVLPPDVAVRRCEAAPDGFDARRDARARAYRYAVWTARQRSVFCGRTALHHPRPLDLGALQACASALVGTHDFTAFTPTETYHVRFERDVASARWVADGELLHFEIEADTFMRNMNRVLVGTMLEVGRGLRDVEGFRALLAGAPRSAAGPTAPARGLTLTGVRYDDGWPG